MFRTLIDSHALFRLVVAIPAIVMLTRYGFAGGGLGLVIQASGEWAVRMLVIALAITPVRILFKGHRWPMWLFKRRRDLGLAAFLYALLHLSAYVIRQSNIDVILYDIQYLEYLFGWIAFALMLVLALTSNDRALHGLGTWWKKIQRLVYLAAVAVFLHWVWIKLDDIPAYVHFLPLVLLEAYRLFDDFSRPSRQRHSE